LGGHSVEDKELKYGLSVTGFVHPDRVLTKKNLVTGDRLILTKPLGTGIVNTAIKGGLASDSVVKTITSLMAALNREAARIMTDYPVHACTDITGFGLIGHIVEMVIGSEYGIVLFAEALPIIPEALEYAAMGLVPAGTYKNREFYQPRVEMAPSIDRLTQDIIFDPQTSGGLLICVSPEAADDLLSQLKENGMEQAAVIGEVMVEPTGKVRVE